ncbi:SRPBCC family protein [soil metagenome]
MDPLQLVEWLPPGSMTGKIHAFEGRVGGGYRMSLFYPSTEQAGHGKTVRNEDLVSVRFVVLEPARRILEAVTFDTTDPSLRGEMMLEVILEEVPGGTDVSIVSTNLPPGLRPEDNEAGSRESLENLAKRFS